MKIQPFFLPLLRLVLASLILVAAVRADIIYTNNGAQIVGQITGVKNGRLEVATSYAGTISILQTAVTGISTQRPLAVQLADGTQAEGSVSAGLAPGTFHIVTPIRTVTAKVSDVRGIWESTTNRTTSTQVARKPTWSFEVSANVNGRSGLKDQLGATLGARTSRVSAQDTFTARVSADRQSTSGVRSADQLKAGVDYQRNLAQRSIWYVRDESGYDRIRDLRLYNIAAGGFGYDLLKRAAVRVTARAGLSYRYEDFSNPVTRDLASLGGDFGLANVMQLHGNSLVNRVTYVQGFDQARTYRLTHESYFELPTSVNRLRMRLGLTNDYNSQVGAGLEKLDTAYFVQLLLLWQ